MHYNLSVKVINVVEVSIRHDLGTMLAIFKSLNNIYRGAFGWYYFDELAKWFSIKHYVLLGIAMIESCSGGSNFYKFTLILCSMLIYVTGFNGGRNF